ncbi:MAG TPA: neuraminidase-like domain-containing protein, partial [Candidatus Krumholzibacteria bacterium]
NYLDKLNEVANLEVVGAFAEGTFAAGTNFVLHVVGRTRSQSRSFFYRTFQGKQLADGVWTPWKRIELDIKADVVVPAVFNGRLHLFWPMIQVKEKGQKREGEFIDGDNAAADRSQQQAEIQLMWSEYIAADNKWLKPKLSKNRAVDPNVPKHLDRAIGDEQPPTEPYNLRVSVSTVEYLNVEVIRTNIDPFALTFVGPSPRRLGTFTIWYTGEDTIDTTTAELPLAGNQPWVARLKSNAAEEVRPMTAAEAAEVARLRAAGSIEGAELEARFLVNFEPGDDHFRFKGNRPFFQRTPGNYRVFGTNAAFLNQGENAPFFYEDATGSFYAENRGVVIQASLSLEQAQKARFSTFNHPLVGELQKQLHVYGTTGLFNRKTEALPIADNRYYSNYYYNYYGHLYLGYHIAGDYMATGTMRRIFEGEFQPRGDTVDAPFPLPTVEFGYGTPFGVYNWELFFHLPMLVADRLSQDMKFEDAMKWYHYVFDPKQELNDYERTKSWVFALPFGARFWNFLPFFANKQTMDSLMQTLGLKQNLSAYERSDLGKIVDEWRRNPFKPHLIARERTVAYQKNVVMKYLDNLIAWADQLFRLDSFESINQATQLYILAADMLGDRPQKIESLTGEARFTYRELRAGGGGIDDFSNAIVEVENLLATNLPFIKSTTTDKPVSPTAPIRNITLKTAVFKIPRNERLDRYWDTVQDRLFKIRNSLNIDGVKRQLSLFQPPIDPALLVRAAAAGLDLSSVISQLSAPLPHYRFSIWSQRAVDLANEVRSFGGALLAALEKKDAEELQLLRQGHEIRILELVRRVRQRQVAEAEENIEALARSRDIAQERFDFYRTVDREIAAERTQISRTKRGRDLETIQGALHTLAGLLAPIPSPTVGAVGFLPSALINLGGGPMLSSAASAGAQAVGTLAAYTRGEAALAGLEAGIERRWQDFKLQERLAKKEIDQVDQQLVAARIRLEIAEHELDNHDTQIEQAKEVREFLEDKFTSRELYQWMVSQLSRTYQQVYRLAFDVAKTAERTFQFELGVDDTYLQFNYVDSLRQGLLAGEKLVYDLKRMDIAYLERNKREFEITKPISLAQLDGLALQRLREDGSCDFELPELLFDLDFPGQYFRRIKAVRLTIPAVTGPYTNVSAKLSLVGSAFRKENAADPSDYPYKGFDDTRFVHDLTGIQSIATSGAQNDAGLFELNFRDERYLPFEGAGAVSRWRLELSDARQFDYHTISDVVLHLSYTARDGGGLLKQGALSDIEQKLNNLLAVIAQEQGEGLIRVFSLKQEFPDVFHQLLTNPGVDVGMLLLPEHFPFLFRDRRLPLEYTADRVELRARAKPDASLDGSLSVNGQDASTINGTEIVLASPLHGKTEGDALLSDYQPETWTLNQTGLDLAGVEDLVFILKYRITN